MPCEDVNDTAWLPRRGERAQFTRAAATLDVSQSALSYTIRGLEKELGLSIAATYCIGRWLTQCQAQGPTASTPFISSVTAIVRERRPRGARPCRLPSAR